MCVLPLLLVVVVVLGSGVSARPTDPVWPDEFSMSFTESTYIPIVGNHSTNGTFYYDWSARMSRVDRANGHYDRYCGSNGDKAFDNTPCTQLVRNGTRFLVYPKLRTCCACCTDAQGCGIVKPTWLAGATYLGTVLSPKGVNLTKWNKKGLQSNIYYERTSDRRMEALLQEPDDFQYFDTASYHTKVTASTFDLPSWCKPDKCSFLSICRHV